MRKALAILFFILFSASIGLMIYFFQEQSLAKTNLKKANSNLAAAHANNKAESDKQYTKAKQQAHELAEFGKKMQVLDGQLKQASQKLTEALDGNATAHSQVAALVIDLNSRDDQLSGVKGQLESFKKLAESERQRVSKFVELGLAPDEILELSQKYNNLLKKSEQLQQRFKDAGMTADELLTRFQSEATNALSKLGALNRRPPGRASRITDTGKPKLAPEPKSSSEINPTLKRKTVPNGK